MEQKVCLITGATGFVGQYILNELIASGRKVLALGDSEDAFSPLAANNRLIKATSALPISAAAFKEHNVQFCFGDIADISFLASIFNTAAKNGIEIEFVLHLAAVRKGRGPSAATAQPTCWKSAAPTGRAIPIRLRAFSMLRARGI